MVPKLATILDEAEPDVLAYMPFPKEHRAKLHSTNPIERLNGEIKRRTDVVGLFPKNDALVRLVGTLLKRVPSPIGIAEVNQLPGTLGEGKFGLFVCLGSCSRPAIEPERNRSNLRLIEGEQFVEMVLENYGKLLPLYRTLLPLKQIYVPDLPKT